MVSCQLLWAGMSCDNRDATTSPLCGAVWHSFVFSFLKHLSCVLYYVLFFILL